MHFLGKKVTLSILGQFNNSVHFSTLLETAYSNDWKKFLRAVIWRSKIPVIVGGPWWVWILLLCLVFFRHFWKIVTSFMGCVLFIGCDQSKTHEYFELSDKLLRLWEQREKMKKFHHVLEAGRDSWAILFSENHFFFFTAVYYYKLRLE